MVRKVTRGGSLLSALLLITIVMLVAATMAGVFTMNMNITQRVYNGSIALSEAEAGLAEVLYLITREKPPEEKGEGEGEGKSKSPKIKFGLDNETLRSTITPGMSTDQAYHVVTFDSTSSFPHSTNNTSLDRDTGALGRTVPDGMLHVVSTGYCNGQYRTVECIIENPPFPFGLATSGPIVSQNPLTVKGVSSLAKLKSGEVDRPGHILCNSSDGVTIRQVNPPRPTEISGFVKSSGAVNIAQPAQVRGGIRSFADVSSLVDIDVSKFRNSGKPGVVTLLDDTYNDAQEMDIMYFYQGDKLTYQSQVDMNKALLYVEGDLVIKGPLTGEGLIVVDGNARFESGTSLSGSNKMAVLCSGDITIRGNDNYFTGLVYCEGNLDASDISIVGNTVVNSSNPQKGQAKLNNVTIVSNEETADMTITVTSSTFAKGQNKLNRFPFPLQLGPDGTFGVPEGTVDGGGLEGWPDPNHGAGDIAGTITGVDPLRALGRNGTISVGKNVNNLWNAALSSDTAITFNEGYVPADAGGLVAGMKSLVAAANKAAEDLRTLSSKRKEEKAMRKASRNGDESYSSGAHDKLKRAIRLLETELTAAHASFEQAANSFGQQVYEYGQTHTDPNGTYDNGLVPMDIVQDHRFNLNEYLPVSERVKISFWRVYPRKL